MCNRCLLLEHGGILADGPAQSLIESYRVSVIESARADDADALHRAYLLATDMARNGQQVPPELEEQGLRYALTIAPDDTVMWQRYVNLIRMQGKQVTPQAEASMILSVLALEPSRSDMRDRLETILDVSAADLSEDVQTRAMKFARTKKTAVN
jgi:ABC-2 type transport system ATP-binding protein